MLRVRRRGRIYYYRAKLPVDVRRLINRSELSYSLHTTEEVHARALALELSAAQLRLCHAIRKSPQPMTLDQIDALVAQYMEGWRTNPEEEAINLGGRSPEEVKAHAEFLRSELRNATEALSLNRLESSEHLARQLLWESQVRLPDEQAFRRLCYRLLVARVDVMRAQVERLPEVTSSQIPPVALEATPAAPTGPRVSELVQEYLEIRDSKQPFGPNTRIEAVAAFGTLVDLLGDPAFGEVRNKDAEAYALKLVRLPNRWRQKFKNKSASEVLRETEGQECKRIAPATFNKELGLVKSFWSWACKNQELTRNAMSAVDPVDVGKVKDKRKPFTEDEMRRIAPILEEQRRTRPERYWVTTLIAYTGARLEEIAQLRKQDVTRVGDTWVIRITGEAGSVKNEASEREVPIHSAVIAKGFLEYLDGVPGERLFASSEREGRVGPPIGKWFGRVLTTLDIADRAKKGMHSFRHSMRDLLIRSGVDPVTRREILGHAHGDIEDQVYGEPTGITERQEALERVKLPI